MADPHRHIDDAECHQVGCTTGLGAGERARLELAAALAGVDLGPFCVRRRDGGTYLRGEVTWAAAPQALAAVRHLVAARREAFLPSPDLDPAWVAGWHAAIDDVLHHLTATAGAGRPFDNQEIP